MSVPQPAGNGDDGTSTDQAAFYAVRARGLPYEATKNEIAQFLSLSNIRDEKNGIHILVGPDGRPTGEAIVELVSQVDIDNALRCHNKNMGRRYIEVMTITQTEMDWELNKQPGAVSI